MEITSKSLHPQSVIMQILMGWQIIVAWRCPRDHQQVQPAQSEVNYTILRAINGMMRPIIPLNRELFIFGYEIH